MLQRIMSTGVAALVLAPVLPASAAGAPPPVRISGFGCFGPSTLEYPVGLPFPALARYTRDSAAVVDGQDAS